MASLSLEQIGNLLGAPVEAATPTERKLARRLFNRIAEDEGADHIRQNAPIYRKTWQLIRETCQHEDH